MSEIMNLPEIFGSDVFSDYTMQQHLEPPVYAAWKHCIATGSALPLEVANPIATLDHSLGYGCQTGHTGNGQSRLGSDFSNGNEGHPDDAILLLNIKIFLLFGHLISSFL